MPSERVRFESSTGASLAARLELPDHPPEACALFAHCFTCSKDLKAVGQISDALTGAGLGVLRFDFTGLGESEGDFSETGFVSDVNDLLAAAEFLAGRLHPPKILVGHSFGGAAVLSAAQHLPSVRAVATIGAPADPAHITHLFGSSIDEIRREGKADIVLGGRTVSIGRAFLEQLESADQQEAIRDLGRALLIFHSPVDLIVGIENAAQIFELARHPKSFVSLDRADHLLTDSTDSRYVGKVLAAWVEKYVATEKEK
ncbi:MAG: alpha/beta hydrolase [Gemmatimonadota bacterium]